jgi:hypothetical protein
MDEDNMRVLTPVELIQVSFLLATKLALSEIQLAPEF